MADPSVVLLIGAEVGILDESNYARTLTAVGNAARTTAQFKYGAASLTFDGVGDWIETPDSTDFTFGAGDFTIEGWFRFGIATNQALMGQWDTAALSNSAWLLYISSSNLTFRFVKSDATFTAITYNWSSLVTGQWYHVAVDKSGSTVRVYVDGAVVASNATVTQTMRDGGAPLVLGALGTVSAFPAFDLNGQIDEVRIVKGLAMYTGAFTPPTGPHSRTDFPPNTGHIGSSVLLFVPFVVGGDLPITGGHRSAPLGGVFGPEIAPPINPSASRQIHVTTCELNPAASGVRWSGIAVGTTAFATPENVRQQVWAVAGEFRNLVVTCATPPGTSGSWTFTLRKNGVYTALTVFLSGTNATVRDTAHVVTVAPGDILTLESSTSGAVSDPTRFFTSIEFHSTNPGESGYANCRPAVGISTSVARYQGVFRMTNDWATTSATAGAARSIAAADGAITAIYVWLGTAPGAAKSWTYTLWKNGVKQDGTAGSVDTRLIITGATDIAGNAAFNLPVAPGDILTLESLPTGTPSSASAKPCVSIRFLATTPGESQFCGGTNTAPGTGSARWIILPSMSGSWDFSEGFVEATCGGPTTYYLSKFQMHGDVAPGAGKSIAYDLRRNSTSPAGTPTATIADTAFGGSDLTSVLAVSDGNKLDLHSVPTGTPSSGAAMRWGFVQATTIPVGDQPVETAARTSALQMFAPALTMSLQSVLVATIAATRLFPPGIVPVFLSLDPSSGSVSGGQGVRLFGTYFPAGVPILVTFDGVPAPAVMYISSTEIQCEVPPGTLGTATVCIYFRV